jgi:Tfp pilus assembly protein PilW
MNKNYKQFFLKTSISDSRCIFSGGMMLVELLIALAVFSIVIIAVGAMGANIFIFNSTTTGSFQATQNAQAILKTILKEIREASPGANGAYPLISAGSTTLSFYSDVDNDSIAEQISYSLIGTNFYRSVIKAAGSPPVYSVANQSTTTLITNVINGDSIPSFQYFDTNYTGTSSPLTHPVVPSSVKLIQINQRIDIDPNRSPLPVIFTVQANIRNLKTNL